MKWISGNENKESQNQQPSPTREEYQSCDSLTQSRYLYDLHQQLGEPISKSEAYKLADEAVGTQS